MKKITLIFLLLLICNVDAQQKYQSLLWKISGNNLTKDSYLYGTMHVSSKVAFRLDDVFYESLYKSDVVALESDPSKWMENSYDLLSMGMSYYSGGSQYNKDFYASLFKLPFPKKRTIRNAIRLDNSLVNSYLYRKQMGSDNFEEETYLDMFIYQAGKKQNKQVIGLEDFNESRSLVTKASYNMMKKQQDKWLRKLYEEKPMYTFTEDAYRDRNLDLLDSIGEASNTEHFRKYMLYKRNENMVNVLDSIMQNYAVFSGVGAAHLPGEKGIIELLRSKGYTVTPLTSKRTSYSKAKKKELETSFTKPHLKTEATPDGFLSIKSFEELRELNFFSQKYYIATDMANGGYLAITRVNTFDYLNMKTKIELKDIDNLLYEDIPGKIIKKEELTRPYPGISILNKTKKEDYQKYHIYKTPLEIVIIKLGGKKDYVLKHGDEIFNSISFKSSATNLVNFTPDFGKYSIKLPQNYITENFGVAGKNIIQSFDNKGYYFMEEVPVHELNFIEEDKFEAAYIHKAFYKNLKLKEDKGRFVDANYTTYQSLAKLDTLKGKKIVLRSIVKDEIYYLMGYVGKDMTAATSYFDSFQLKDIVYKKEFKQVKDTALHFSVLTNIKQPFPMNFYGNNGSAHKPYEYQTKTTKYISKTNESIFITRTKYHDYKMVKNIDSLWSQIDKSFVNRFILTNKEKRKENDLYSYSFFAKDSLSAKRIRVKNILKKGVLFELKTLEDSISPSSEFVNKFYKTFTPLDTLLGRDVFESKVTDYFKALKNKDSIVDNADYLIEYTEADVDAMIATLNDFEFPKDKKFVKGNILYNLSSLKSAKILPFLKKLYRKSYADPKTQIAIIEALIAKRNIESYKLILSLLEEDFPIGSYGMSNLFDLPKAKDSLQLKRKLFPELLKYSTIQEYKKPVYGLLSQLKDSSLVKPRVYKRYKDQIFNDAKIELKRSLIEQESYAYNTLLSNYINLLYPFREEKNIAHFYLRLLESNDINALSDYYVLLKTKGEAIPKKLEDKTLNNIDNLNVLIPKLNAKNLLPEVFKTGAFQLKYAQSVLFSLIYDDYDDDKISFFKKEELVIKNKPIDIYFFKVKGKEQYSNSATEWLYYVAFKRDGKKIDVAPYFIMDTKSVSLKGTKTEDELVKEALDKIRYKERRRLQSVSNNYNY